MSEAIRQPYIHLGQQMKEWINGEIARFFETLSPAMPCKVIVNNGVSVDVQPLVNLNTPTLIIKAVPIAKTKYLNQPITSGDRGLLVPATYLYGDLVNSTVDYISDPKTGNKLGAYIFLPISQASGDHQSAGMSDMVMYSQDGSSFVAVQNGDVVINSDEEISFNALKTFLDEWQANYNQNITKITSNNSIIVGAFSGLSVPITLQDPEAFNGSYR